MEKIGLEEIAGQILTFHFALDFRTLELPWFPMLMSPLLLFLRTIISPSGPTFIGLENYIRLFTKEMDDFGKRLNPLLFDLCQISVPLSV